jgi:hypothetical protein
MIIDNLRFNKRTLTEFDKTGDEEKPAKCLKL